MSDARLKPRLSVEARLVTAMLDDSQMGRTLRRELAAVARAWLYWKQLPRSEAPTVLAVVNRRTQKEEQT